MKDTATQQSAGDRMDRPSLPGDRRCHSWTGTSGGAGSLLQPCPRQAALGQAQGKSQGPPSSDKGNLDRKGKTVKRGAKGHKGKKNPNPVLNKTAAEDCC